ncbi:hypothetical protein LTR37_001469 [Vermiconidia calcicola]|uniref:Uncharacterized protein n=1 Tax=Vermiconidia calcicola TaxID=1690605 RepID=A0ACC3NW20_9PEZI|nr:hypothetical protein LTR37_001469 [Vermiconidia calcicola]
MDPNFAASTVSHFTSRLRSLRSDYIGLQMSYSRLFLTQRRYLYGSIMTPTKTVHAVAEAKFFLAAALQFVATGGLQSKKAEGEDEMDELCPVWMGFFDDLLQAATLVGQSQQDLNAVPDIATVDTLLVRAEAKYNWLQSLYATVSEHGEHDIWDGSEGPELTLEMVCMGWNRFCAKLAFRSVSLRGAIAAIRRPDMLTQADQFEISCESQSRREYFAFAPEADFQPWVQYGLQMLEEPKLQDSQTIEHFVAARRAWEERQWDLVNNQPWLHHDLVDGEKFTAPLDFCPMKMRGDECANPNCVRNWPSTYGCSAGKSERQADAGVSTGDAVAHGTKSASPRTKHRPSPIAVEHSPTLDAYNEGWNDMLQSPSNPWIPFPTPSFTVDDMTEKRGLGLAAEGVQNLSFHRCAELKTWIFFLNGMHIPWTVELFPVRVQPHFETGDAERIKGSLEQLNKEDERWDARQLSQRTGQPDLVAKELGNDWLPVAIRKAIQELKEVCLEELRWINGERT